MPLEYTDLDQNTQRKNLHVCTVHQWRLKHFIIQQMHKCVVR